MAEDKGRRLHHRDRTSARFGSNRRRWSSKYDSATDEFIHSRVNNESIIEDDSSKSTSYIKRKPKQNKYSLDITNRSHSSQFHRNEQQNCEEENTPPTPDPALLDVKQKLFLFESMEKEKSLPGTLAKYKSKSSELLLTSERKCVTRWEKYPQKSPQSKNSFELSYHFNDPNCYENVKDQEVGDFQANDVDEEVSSVVDGRGNDAYEEMSASVDCSKVSSVVDLQTNIEEVAPKIEEVVFLTPAYRENRPTLEAEEDYPNLQKNVLIEPTTEDFPTIANGSEDDLDNDKTGTSETEGHFHRRIASSREKYKPWTEAINKPILTPAFIKYMGFDNEATTEEDNEKTEVEEAVVDEGKEEVNEDQNDQLIDEVKELETEQMIEEVNEEVVEEENVEIQKALKEELTRMLNKRMTTDFPNENPYSHNNDDRTWRNTDLWTEEWEPSEEMSTKSIRTPDFPQHLTGGQEVFKISEGENSEENEVLEDVIVKTKSLDLQSQATWFSQIEARYNEANMGSRQNVLNEGYEPVVAAVHELPLTPIGYKDIPKIMEESAAPEVEEVDERQVIIKPNTSTFTSQATWFSQIEARYNAANMGSRQNMLNEEYDPVVAAVDELPSTPISHNDIPKIVEEVVAPEVEEVDVRQVIIKPNTSTFTRNYRSLSKISASRALNLRGVKYNSLQPVTDVPSKEDKIDVLHKGYESIQPILEELIKTEETYVEALWAGLSNYGNLFERKDLPKGLKGKKYVLFANVEQIAEFHRDEFLPMLLRNRNDLKRIFDEFQQFIEQNCFYGYVIYAMNNQRSLILCDAYKKYFKMIQTERNDNLGINSFLLQPIQRVARYPLLLKEFIKKLFDNYPLKATIDSCCRLDKKFQNLLNATNKSEVINDLMSIKETHEFNIFYQGKFREVNEFNVVDHTLRRSYRSKVFLYDKCIIYTEMKRKELAFRGRYPREHIGIIGQHKSFTLYYDRRKQQECDFMGDPALVKHWLDLITEIVTSYAEEERARLKRLRSLENGLDFMRRKSPNLLLFRDTNRFSLNSGFGNS